MNTMNDFYRAYEFEEERGVAGFLLLFLLSLVSFDLVAAIILLSQSGMMVRAFWPALALPYFTVWGLYFLFKLVFCVLLFTKRQRVPKVAVAFLAARIAVFLAAAVMLYVLVLQHPYGSPIHLADEMRSVWQITYSLLLAPVVYTLAYSLGWMLYFKRSRRVRERFHAKPEA